MLKISKHVGAEYVLPEVGKKYSAALQQFLTSDSFDEASTPTKLASYLNRCLQKVSPDQHLAVRARINTAGQVHVEGFRALNHGFRKVEIFDGNIGYLELRELPPPPYCDELLPAAMKLLNGVDALIIDVRKNHGGLPKTARLLCSWFFAEPTTLGRIEIRRGNYR